VGAVERGGVVNEKYICTWRITTVWLQILLSLLFSTTVLGQTTTNESDDDAVCGLRPAELVFVQVEIEDDLGRQVENLKHEAFIVYEDDARQEIITFEEKEILIFGRRRAIYRIGYYSTNDKLDGSLRIIKIELIAQELRKLRGRYYPVSYLANIPTP
jgi:hypothetical protein